MFRKLIALALIGGGVAAAIKRMQQSGSSSDPAGSDQPAGSQPSAADTPPTGNEPAADDLAEVRSGQTEATVQAPVAGVGDDEQAAIPDVSDEDPLVREQEQAAAEDAGSIGGEVDSATADTDPSMRPVYEGSGGDTETFEATDEQGR